jgi:hypothetical protein
MATVNVRNPKNVNLDDDDNIYYNIRITNNEDTAKQAIFSENRVEPILENPSEYELAVVRFSVPALFIPIFLWKTPTPFSVYMRYDGALIEQELEFIERANNPKNPPYGEAVWNYQQFIDIINEALKKCWDSMVALKPLQPTTEPPYLTFDAKTQLCSINAEQLYDDSTDTIQIFFSKRLFVLFPSFEEYVETITPTLTIYRMRIKNNKNNEKTINGSDYYVMEQEYPTLFLWNDFTTIVFETDSIPIEPEFLPSQTNVVRRLLTDFEPLSDINNRQTFQYFPQGKVRYYDMKSSYPMKRVDLRVYWETKDGAVYPIYLGETDVLTMKILFRKKPALQIEQALYPDEDEI